MKIKVKNSELSNALSNLGKVTPSKAIEPILENILLKAEGDSIFLSATNLQQGMISTLVGEIVQEGENLIETVLPFNILRDLILKFSNELDTEIHIDSRKAVLKQGSASYSLNCFNPESFAILPEVKGNVKFMMNFNDLKELIEDTYFAASKKEESRKEFKGVLLDVKNSELRFVSTDSTALALNKVKSDLPEISIIIPSKTMDILNKLDVKDEQVEVIFDENSIKFTFTNLTLISLLINGKFPSYEAVIPETLEYKAEVNRNALLEALKRVNILASKGSERITLTFSDGNLVVESTASEVGEGKERLTCQSNAEITMCFYGDKLISGIEHVKDEIVFFGINGPLHPVVIKGLNNERYTYVIMPQKPIE